MALKRLFLPATPMFEGKTSAENVDKKDYVPLMPDDKSTQTGLSEVKAGEGVKDFDIEEAEQAVIQTFRTFLIPHIRRYIKENGEAAPSNYSVLNYFSKQTISVIPNSIFHNNISELKETIDSAKNLGNSKAQQLWDKNWGLVPTRQTRFLRER